VIASTRTSLPLRDELVSALVAAVPRPMRTLAVELLAESFVDAYVDPAKARQPLAIVDWVGRMCDVHGDAPGVPALFLSACATIERYVGARSAFMEARMPLRFLDDAIGAIVAKRRGDVVVASNRLGEVDARINALIQQLERSDPLSADHSRAVGAWCTRLARRLSLSDELAVTISRGGLLHDVGKITTPSEILHAPRKLTDEEFDVMRSHTTAGERIIAEHEHLVEFASTARSHHERLDGRGYPDRLSGDDIPLAIRIVTVADCFNAMIGRRPYRPPMSPAAALDELTRGCGTQFDPVIVAAMRDVVFALRREPDALERPARVGS
jgi:putative nucleotidyltransferase with HDIG domain